MMSNEKTKKLEQKLAQAKERIACDKRKNELAYKHAESLLIDCDGDVSLMMKVIQEIDVLAKMLYSCLEE